MWMDSRALCATGVAIVMSGGAAAVQPSTTVEVASPDGAVVLTVSTAAGRLEHETRLNGHPVVEPSPMGVRIDGVDLGAGAEIVAVDRYELDERYPWRGVHATAVNRCGAARVTLRHTSVDRTYTLDARACGDGTAFRFVVPGTADERRTPDAATTFRIPRGSALWVHDLDRGHYEGVHARKPVEALTAGEWAAPPVTVRLPGGAGFGAITEAALFEYPGMALQADGDRGLDVRLGHAVPASYPFTLRYEDDVERMARPASIAGTITTPWRVVITAADLNGLVNADIVHNLAPPPDPHLFPAGFDTPWLRPGRAVWKYLDGGENTLAEMKTFSRLAGELGFEHHVVEGFWQKWTPEQLKELVEYSAARGVGIWLWKHSRDLQTVEARRAFFELCRQAGVVGAKVDFFDHEALEVVERYEAILREAAKFRLMINFHGANKPTGESRTWPNELTREAIYGLEYRRTETRAAHDATIPFTRFLAGHADYTPVIFGERRKDTTWAHQIATAVVFTSPLLIYGAHPATLLAHPAVDVIRRIPSVWDETVVLPQSEIGERAVFARRRHDDWFLAVVNGPARGSIRVPVSFLGPGRYTARLVSDREDAPDAIEIGGGTYTRQDVVEIRLRAGGGFIARFSPHEGAVAPAGGRPGGSGRQP